MRRLLLVRHAPTRGDARVRVPGRRAARRARPRGRRAALSVPPRARGALAARRCAAAQTAAGRRADRRRRSSRGSPSATSARWAGRTLDGRSPSRTTRGAWMTDPDAAPHGGESLRGVRGARRGLARRAGDARRRRRRDHARRRRQGGGRARAAARRSRRSGASTRRRWRVTELHAHDGRWTVTSERRDARRERGARRGRGVSGGGARRRLRRRRAARRSAAAAPRRRASARSRCAPRRRPTRRRGPRGARLRGALVGARGGAPASWRRARLGRSPRAGASSPGRRSAAAR